MGVDTDKVGGTWGGAARTRCWGVRDHLHPLLPLHPRAPLPQSPLWVPAPQLTRPAAAPAPGQRREGAATHRLCRSQRLCRLGRGGGAFSPPASPWTARPQPRPPPQPLSPTAPQSGRGLSVGRGSAARVRGTSRSWEAQVQRQPRLALVQSPASARVASDPSPPPRLPVKHSPKVICYLFEGWGCQIQPRISPKLALVGMASLSSLSMFKESSRTFSNRHTHTNKPLWHLYVHEVDGFSFSLTCSLLRYLCQAMA